MLPGKKFLFILLALLVVLLFASFRIAGLKANLATQTARAKQAEEKVASLEAAAVYRTTQVYALHEQAAQCEQDRAKEAADAAERRAILSGQVGMPSENIRTGQSPVASTGRAHADLYQPLAAPGGIVSPPLTNANAPEKEDAHAHSQTRHAVADRLNRPL